MRLAFRILCVASVFLSAFLLFVVQPMLARILLPLYGGAPAVWNTSLVFFQIALLVGYACATFIASRRPIASGIMQATLLLASIPFLPRGLRVHEKSDPSMAILITLSATIALHFVVLASNSIFTQRWYVLAGDENPFWLYAASNAGSLSALLAYPLIIERVFGIKSQIRFWRAGYVGFVALTVLMMLVGWRRFGGRTAFVETTSVMNEPIAMKRRLGWLLRAAVGTSLLLSVTTQITTDVGATPLFWVLPLALYLVSFILAFSTVVPRRVLAVATTIGIAVSMALVILPSLLSLSGLLIVSLGTLFVGSWLCHQDLAQTRPSASRLAEFYLWIAAGGAIGGVLNALIAPLIFDLVGEYPLTLFVLAALVQMDRPLAEQYPRERMRQLSIYLPPLTVALALLFAWAALSGILPGAFAQSSLWSLMPIPVLFMALAMARHRGQFPFAVAAVTLFVLMGLHSGRVVAHARSFFGVLFVTDSESERSMIHGTTLHGSQRKEPNLRSEPTAYYYRGGPFGSVMKALPPGAEIGVIGLGTGAIAALARPGDRITFFEIDPLVETMARAHFTYLVSSAASQVQVRIRDGRLAVADSAPGTFDSIIADAFSSDGIPVHLLTREAIDLYLSRVKPRGLVLFHISNRHVALQRIFRGWESAGGGTAAMFVFRPTEQQSADGATRAVVIAISPSPERLEELMRSGGWRRIDPATPAVVWTDDHIDMVAVLRSLLPWRRN